LDKTSNVHKKGGFAVLRQLISDFLRQRRERKIDAQYERAYGGVQDPLGEDFEGWEKEGSKKALEPLTKLGPTGRQNPAQG
jgi:hypothetical protein